MDLIGLQKVNAVVETNMQVVTKSMEERRRDGLVTWNLGTLDMKIVMTLKKFGKISMQTPWPSIKQSGINLCTIWTERYEIPEKLQEWATNYSHVYMAYYEPESLQVDTNVPLTEWKVLVDMDTAMEDTSISTEGSWINVPERGRRRGKSPPQEPENEKRNEPGGNMEAQHHPKEAETQRGIPARQAIKELHNQLKQSKRYQKTMKPASKLPQVSTVHEEDEDEVLMEDNDSNNKSTSTTWSEALPRLKPFQNVPVNDGTHRLTVRWKPEGGIQQYEHDKQQLNTAIHTLLSSVLEDNDGMLYRWESKDLQASAVMSQLTGMKLRDYVSPHISFIQATSQIIFGVRVGFTDNPMKWQHAPSKKQQLKENNVEIKVSNSSSAGGKAVIAGYILLKAPNTTSTHRYTQFLRSKMPDATPYFDIERYKKTPFGQVIPHLVVQCGERHITPVCQALLQVLTGNGTATFLPRYVFSAMTDEQINNQFQFHEKWLHSIKALQLSPTIFHLDQQRIEYCDDGRIIKQSTREWAGTLRLPDGSTALCDVVNGTKERQAYLLTPAHYFDQAKEELRLYRLRLSPPSHREARFRDSVPDLPDEIHIKTAADSKVSMMDNLSMADVWQHLPTYKEKVNVQSSMASERKTRRKQSQISTPKNAWVIPSEASTHPSSTRFAEQQQVLNEDDSFSTEGRNSLGTDELSTASTQSLTLTSESKYQAKLRELETSTKKKLDSLHVAGRAASKQLESLEDKFNAFATDTSTKIEAVQSELKTVVQQLEASVDTQQHISGSLSAIQTHTATQFEQMGDHLLTTGENVSSLTTSMTEIRAELARLFGLMAQDIAFRNASSQATHLVKQTKEATSLRSRHTNRDVSSKQDLVRDTPAASIDPNQEVSLRSPPPKRLREGVTLHHEQEEDRATDEMQMDENEDTSPMALLATNSEIGYDDNTETSNEEIEYEWSSQEEEEACTNLSDRFQAAITDDTVSDNGTPIYATSQTSVTPRATNVNVLQSVHSRKSPRPTTPAPLGPQYTSEMGPAGAADS
ncbi:hypothetical protein MHU86_24202 [Fragilaria crotonensis]|nr:hypothetical protein MHU86_24202 [Fragilaria crotonensis]